MKTAIDQMMKNNMFKTMKNKVSDVCRKALVPAVAGAVYAASNMTVTVCAVGADTRIHCTFFAETEVTVTVHGNLWRFFG